MQELIEVIFRCERFGYCVNPKGLKLEPDMKVIVKVDRGENIGRVVNCSYHGEEPDPKEKPVKPGKITRIATDEDYKQLQIVKQKEKDAQIKFLELVKPYPFDMKLIDVIYQLDGNKLTFFFSADGRVDFRDFVKQLATEFKTRIELHQSSGREDARRLGGLGICGKTYCCITFLKKFNQVTIRMAKDQNLINNLTKISGPCGRLLCCLHYEEDFYLEKSVGFPDVDDIITYQKEKCKVTKTDFYNGKIYLLTSERQTKVITLDEYKKQK
jgi:cell fate regulator YaaT (PSP1 superfamily)